MKRYPKFMLHGNEVCVIAKALSGVTYLIPVRLNDLWRADFCLGPNRPERI